MNEKKRLLFLVDDDALFLKSLEIEFANNTECVIKTFPTGELCLENLSQNPDVIILDYHLNSIEKDAINGLETLNRIKKANQTIPVIMLSAQDKIEVAVNCMKHQAYDYIVKSETAFIRLRKAMTTILHYQKIEKTLNWYMEKLKKIEFFCLQCEELLNIIPNLLPALGNHLRGFLLNMKPSERSEGSTYENVNYYQLAVKQQRDAILFCRHLKHCLFISLKDLDIEENRIVL